MPGTSVSTSTSPAHHSAQKRHPPLPSREQLASEITPRLLSAQVVCGDCAAHATSAKSAAVNGMFRLAISGLTRGGRGFASSRAPRSSPALIGSWCRERSLPIGRPAPSRGATNLPANRSDGESAPEPPARSDEMGADTSAHGMTLRGGSPAATPRSVVALHPSELKEDQGHAAPYSAYWLEAYAAVDRSALRPLRHSQNH